jgi:hypothetical protein
VKAPGKALLLNGSPKPGASTSESLVAYLGEELEKLGVSNRTVKLTKAVRSEEHTAELLAAIDGADLVVLSFPLYWDSLPGHVVRACELIAAHRAAARASVGSADATAAERPAFVAIVQGGFPEVEQNAVAVEICRNFARAADLEWAGGLALGGGGMIYGAPLRKLGSRVKTAMQALDGAAAALAAGGPVPDEAVRLMAKNPPAIVLRLGANRSFRSQHKKKGKAPLDARPFATPPEPR